MIRGALKRYERYKDSGVEWLGEVPAHWEVKRLKDIGNSIIGITYSPEDVLDGGKEGVLVLRSSNIQNSKLCLKDTVFVNIRISKKQTVRQGDILICSRNGSRALIGKNIIIDEFLSGNTFGAFMTVYRSKYFRFIHKFFNSKIFESQSGLSRIIHKPGQFVKKHHTKAIFRLMHPENMKRHNDNRILSDLLNKQTKNQLKRVDESPGLCFFI